MVALLGPLEIFKHNVVKAGLFGVVVDKTIENWIPPKAVQAAPDYPANVVDQTRKLPIPYHREIDRRHSTPSAPFAVATTSLASGPLASSNPGEGGREIERTTRATQIF